MREGRTGTLVSQWTPVLKMAAFAVLTWVVLSGATAHAALTADYQFQNTLASSVSAPALTDLGAGNSFVTDTVDATARTVLQFPEGNGLSLSPTTGVIPSNLYTIVILFRFDTVSGYRKIVDFKNGTIDSGLYNRTGDLYFFPSASGSGAPIGAGSYVQVALTRDAGGTVVGYVDGTQQFSFADTTNLAVIDSNNTLRFFLDDTVQGTEQSAGAVARIRLFDTALSPSEIAALDRLPEETSVPPASIPTLSEWAQIGMAAMLVGGGVLALRRNRRLS